MQAFRPGYADPRGALIYGFDNLIVLAQGTTVPPNATPGYSPGGIFIDRDAAIGAQFWINEGTGLSSLFHVVALGGLDLSGLLATAAELNRSSDMSTRVVPLTTTPISITEAAHDGKTMYITKTDGIAITLPVPVAGMKFRFVIGATIASASSIKSVAGTHIMIGHALMGNDSDNTVVLFQAPAASTFDTINLLGTGNSTGGMEGQVITIEAMSATVWLVEIVGDAAGTEATPFENTVT